MGRIINNYEAYDVSPLVIERDREERLRREREQAEKDRKEQEWMNHRIAILQAEMEGKPLPPSLRTEIEEAQKPRTKRCSICRRVLPLDDFNLMASSPDGHQYRCRACTSIMAKVQRQSGKRERSVVSSDTKRCKKCGKVLPKEQFYRNVRVKDGREGTCKRCRYECQAARATRLRQELEQKGKK